MNENAALKLSIDENKRNVFKNVQEMKIGIIKRSMEMLLAIIVEERVTCLIIALL